MGMDTQNAFSSLNDEELLQHLTAELGRLHPFDHSSQEFILGLRTLPRGFRAMAATYELDVSLTLDDLGWHFGNWHDLGLAAETLNGLKELGADELAMTFGQALEIAQLYWDHLQRDDWTSWYPESRLARSMEPLNQQAWKILEGKKQGIFVSWVSYARKHAERLR